MRKTSKHSRLLSAATLLLLSSVSRPSLTYADVASIQEIPYYLRQLQEAELESKRMEFNKIIHDAVVFADLSDKKVVKDLEPTIEKIQIAMDSGLDRPYLEGSSLWLASAVEYFEREKNRPQVKIPRTEWLAGQITALNGNSISIYPDKILLKENGIMKVVAESAGIHEAIISPDGKRVAFFRKTSDETKPEVWVVNLKNSKRKKIAILPSCETLLFSIDGSHLFLQEKRTDKTGTGNVYRVSANGGSLKVIGKAAAIETIVASGEHKGALIVYQARLHHMGITIQECPVAWNESGKEIGRIKEELCR